MPPIATCRCPSCGVVNALDQPICLRCLGPLPPGPSTLPAEPMTGETCSLYRATRTDALLLFSEEASVAQPPRYIALLRAINVGGHTVKMDHLRKLFEALGLAGVETFIASGNVIFDAPDESIPALEKRIERHLQQSLGYEVITFIRSAAEIAAIASYQPFAASEPAMAAHSLYIAFLADRPGDEAQQRLMAFRSEIDDFHIHRREAYWLCRTKSSESSFSGALLEKILKMPATIRNVTTVKKLAAKYAVER